ncbi:hypothetical protein P8452_56025 [Trifolium repens]|nr:hypothetical protein P8452_56025 [Trifolium repens]
MKMIAITQLLLLFLLVSSSEAMVESCESVNDHLTPCLTYLAAQILIPKAQNAIDLPKKCGVQFPFEISATIDCSRVV